MKKFSITTPIAYGVIAIGIFFSLIKPQWMMTPTLVVIALMAVLSIVVLRYWPKREPFNQPYIAGFKQIPLKHCLVQLIVVPMLFWLSSGWLMYMLGWLMSQSGRLQVSAPAVSGQTLLENYLIWLVAPFVFILGTTLAKIYLAFVRQQKPQAADFLFPNANQQPKLFFHNVLVGVEGYGKVIGLSFWIAACVLIFANAVTRHSYVPDLIDWPIQNTLFSLLMFVAFIKIMKHMAGFLQRKVKILGPMLLVVAALTTFMLLFWHTCGLMVTYPKLLYHHSLSPMLTQLSASGLEIRFEFFWLSWVVVWAEELSQFFTRLSYGYNFRAMLVGIMVSALVMMGCFYLSLHVPISFLEDPIVQMCLASISLLLMIAWFWSRDCAVKMRYGCLLVPGKHRSLVLFIRRFLPLMPLLVGAYLMFGWMAAQFFTGAVLLYWVPIMGLYLGKAAMTVWVFSNTNKNEQWSTS